MKLVMCVAIVLIGSAIGRQLAKKMAVRLRFFREYQSAFTALSDKVVGVGVELYKALCASQSDAVRPFFDACAHALKKNPQLRFDVIWQRSLSSASSGLDCLTKTDMRLLLDGGEAVEALCGNPSEKQAGLYLKRLCAYLETLEQEKNKKCKLYNTAGLLGGLLIALLVV